MALTQRAVMTGEHPPFGSCCHCFEKEATAFLFLPYQTTQPGTGWGCNVCGQPANGAIAVLCADCYRQNKEPHEIVDGPVGDMQRIGIYRVKQTDFGHLLHKHPEYAQFN